MPVGNRIAILALTVVVVLAILPAALPVAPGGPERPDGGRPGVDTVRDGGTLRLADSSDVWQSYPPPAGFPTLFDPSVASDPVDRSLVVFGGCPQFNCSTVTNATWTESNGLWTPRHPAVAPVPRTEAQMAWDPADGYVLLFGGIGCLDPPTCNELGALNDTWAFKGGAWNPVISSGSAPPPTDLGGLAYDPSDRAMVLFGGSGCASICETWTYSGGTWTLLNLTTPHPPARYGEGFTEDDSDHGALLFGGRAFSGSGALFNDTWLFSNGRWIEENVSQSPPARWDPAMAWDPGVGAAVLFGGRAGGSLLETDNDTWLFEGGAWTEWVGPSSPGPAWQAGAAQDPTTGILVLVGGGSCSSSDCPSTTPWGFGPQHAVSVSIGTGTCANLSLAGAPLRPGDAAELQNGTYPLRIATCSGFQVANVTATALLLANATAENVTA